MDLRVQESSLQDNVYLMARAKFRAIIPTKLDPKLFDAAFQQAARDMENDVKDQFEEVTKNWKKRPVWRGYVRVQGTNIYISVGTQDEIFKYVDEGTKAHFIKPVRAKVLHWVDPSSGEDRYSMGHNVKGITPRKISENIQKIWENRLMIEYFEGALVEAAEASGHAV